jgi:hypothetical protein
MARFFDDIGQDSTDLLTKGFPNAGTVKVSAETKTNNGVSLVATGRRFLKSNAANVELGFEPKYDWSARNVELSAKVNTSSEYSGTVTLKDFLAKGTKFAGDIAVSEKGSTYKETVSYKNDNVATKASVSHALDDSSKPMVIEGSVAGTYEKRFFGGLNATFTSGTSAFGGGAKLGLDQSDFQAHLFAASTEKSLLLGAGWFQKASAALKVAARASTDVKGAVGHGATLASEYKFDDLTTLKSKVSLQTFTDESKPAEARVSLGLKQLLSANFTATLGADVNARQLLGSNSGGDHTFGLELKLA